MENRVELCCHTKMSTLQGINSAREYIKTAIDRGDKAIAITDVDSVQSFFDANEYLRLYAKNTVFKIIYGSEMHFKISENTDKLYTIYIYVKEQEGLKNLYELISKAYKNIIDGIPVIYKKDLIEYRSGLLYAAIGNQSEVYQNIEIANIDAIMKFYDFIGIEPNESEKSTNIIINNLCNKNNKLLIGTSECNFINKEDFKCNELLNFYKKNPDIEYENNKYFYTTDELIKSFDYIENSMKIVIDNTAKIAEQIEKINIIPHKINYPKIESANKIIYQKCYVMAKKIYGTTLPEKIKERLELELNSIKNNNFASIYLISSDMVEYSNRLGYGVTSRGSVGDSFVAYLLGITDINPIEYNLPFEFFAGINYDKEPDIDLNFSEIAQAKIFDFLQEKYGKDKIIWGGTIGTIADETLENCNKEYLNTFEIDDIPNREFVLEKLAGIKKFTSEHHTEAFYKVYAELEDNYNLINSKAIGNYCRSIKHKFNTEELAVLVYRNNRMTIEEKIEKYTNLISNYPDMEVIERINCKHYDSVKTMIKEEVQRLNALYKKLITGKNKTL